MDESVDKKGKKVYSDVCDLQRIDNLIDNFTTFEYFMISSKVILNMVRS